MFSLRPGVNKRWEVIILPFYGQIDLGNFTQFTIGMFSTLEGRIFIGVEGHGAYTFAHFVHWSYAVEKLKLLESDARNLSDFINAQLYCNEKEQGYYQTDLCK